jgi:nicotinamide mononucleotide transporter
LADVLAYFTLAKLGEHLAIALALAYLVLIIKERIEGWYCAFISTAIYTVLFWNVSLVMESALNLYYMAMAVYGWWSWQTGRNKPAAAIHRWPIKLHLMWIGLILLAAALSGYLLSNHTSAAFPFLDSFTTWAAVFTTFLVAKKVLENWIYWMVINSVSVFLYIDRGLYETGVLFISYLALSVWGYNRWQQEIAAQTTPAPQS